MPLDTSAGTVLAFTPEDWRRPLDWLPVLAAYIAGSEPGSDVCLCLDARDGGLAPAVVGTMVARAADYLGEGLPFAEVLLIQDPLDLGEEGADPIGGAGELVARLGLQVPALREDDPTEVVRHAQWVKTLVDELQAMVDRARFEAAPAPSTDDPLVTVRIPTFGSPDLLVERAIPSVVGGAYGNVELLVCSDGPQPHARAAVEHVDHPRIRYLEVEERPRYPSRPISFWRVAGTSATNRLLDEARGAFIAPLDHDDAFTVDHVTALLDAVRRTGADFAYGQAMTEYTSGAWGLIGTAPLAYGQIVHASVLYSRRLGHMRYDPDAWLIGEPGDWNMWRRMQAAGAGIAHLPAPVAVHFKEGTSMAGRSESPESVLAATAQDVLGTPARRLLGVASRGRGGLELA